MIYKTAILGGNTGVSYLSKTTKEDIMEGNYDRPIGVSILAILLIINGAVLLVAQLLAFSKLNEASSFIGVSNVFFQGALGFLGVLGITAGIGMWRGKKVGWWLAIFYFAYEITRNVNAWFTIKVISDQFAVSGQSLNSYYIKYGIRILWNVLILYFMCRENVTFFFNTTETKKWKALLIVFAYCIAILLLGSILNLFN